MNQCADNWFSQQKHHKDSSIVIIEYQKKLIDEGCYEAYIYRLINRGDPDGFIIWYDEKDGDFTKFIDWFRSNSMTISNNDTFSRLQY